MGSPTWPCVGPAGDFDCSASGVLSLIGLVPGEDIAHTDHEGPVLVHLTVCRDHVRAARSWLHRFQLPGDEVDTYGTEMVLRHWHQLELEMAPVPVWRAVLAA